MNTFDKQITIPDLRFEKSFLRSLQRYANTSTGKPTGPLTEAELKLLDEHKNEEIDDDDDSGNSRERLKPVGPITPGIVAYAVIKDIVIRPLLEGFTWALLVILFRPTLRLVTAQGHRMGSWLATILGRPPTRGF
ncbi:hypothetical protein OXX69_004516 [Metschnikowia pulcherrima]